MHRRIAFHALLALAAALAATSASSAQVAFAPAAAYPVYLPAGYGVMRISLGDVDGDGAPDVVTTLGANPAFLRNLGDGTFGPPEVFFCGTYPPNDVVAVDIDGDADADVAAGNAWPGFRELAIARNLGGGVFAPVAAFPLPESPGEVAAGDLTGDGRPEIIVALGSMVQIFVNNGGSTFTPGPALPVTVPDALRIADLDGDGDRDIAAGRANAFPQVQVFRNLGGGSFQAVSLTPGPTGGYAGDGPHALAAADFDADGDLDLVGTRTAVSGLPPGAGGSLLLWVNSGNLAFAAPAVIPVGGYNRPIESADVDRDGRSDLIVGDTIQNRIHVLRRLPGGSFATPVALATAQMLDLQTGDLDADGDPDLLTSHTQLAMLRNLDSVSALPPYPGSGEDFHLLTGVNLPPTTGAGLTIKAARAQDLLVVRLASPGQTFTGEPLVLAAQLFTTGFPPGSPPGVPMIHVGIPGAVLLLNGFAGPIPFGLPAPGMALNFTIPAGFAGQSILFQSAVFSAAAQNAFFAATDGHEIQVLP